MFKWWCSSAWIGFLDSSFRSLHVGHLQVNAEWYVQPEPRKNRRHCLWPSTMGMVTMHHIATQCYAKQVVSKPEQAISISTVDLIELGLFWFAHLHHQLLRVKWFCFLFLFKLLQCHSDWKSDPSGITDQNCWENVCGEREPLPQKTSASKKGHPKKESPPTSTGQRLLVLGDVMTCHDVNWVVLHE